MGQADRGGPAPQTPHRNAALGRLPVTYALALRLRDAGADDTTLAERLGIAPQAVGPLLAVADAKLAALQDDRSTHGTP